MKAAELRPMVLDVIKLAIAEGRPAPKLYAIGERLGIPPSQARYVVFALASDGALIRETDENRIRYIVPGFGRTGWLTMTNQKNRRPRPGSLRACMTCTKPFRSEGIHNRMCRECTRTASDYHPDFIKTSGVLA